MFTTQLKLALLVLAARTVDAGEYVSLVQHRADRVAAPLSLAAAGSRTVNTMKRSAAKDAPHPIVDYLQFDFSRATMQVNNLGGKGPDTDSNSVMQVKNVTVYKNMSINMIIEALTPYAGNVENNQVAGEFLKIHMQENTSTDFKATFVDGATGLPVMLPDMTLSFWDVDKGKDGHAGVKNITIGPIIAYYVTRDTEIRVQELQSSFVAFQGSTHGAQNDNPKAMAELSRQQLARGVEVEMATTSEVNFSLHVGPNEYGRIFYIGGRNPLSESGVRQHVGICKGENELQLADPLGVMNVGGNDLRFGEIMRVGNKKVDLMVEFDDDYVAHNISKNGLFGSNFMINLADNTSSDVTFTFIDPSTNESMLVENFAFAVFDVDGTKSGYEQVAIRKSADLHYWVSTNSSVNVMEDDGKLTFRSTVVGDFENNPTVDGGLTTEQIANTVLLWYDEPISKFTLTLTTKQIWTGRDFEIGMASRIFCPLRFHYEPENPCEDTSTSLVFDEVEVITNDIRGDGIRIAEAGFAQSTRIDLIITADDSYRAWNESKNGVSGGLLNLNVADGVKTKITFQFVEHGTNTPFPIKKFFLTILDLDGTRVGRERVGMRTKDFTTYFRHPMTDVAVDEKENYTIFNSASFGSAVNNPLHWESIDQEEHKNSISLYFKEPTDKVQFTLEAENAWTGRNFMFTGNTNLACRI